MTESHGMRGSRSLVPAVIVVLVVVYGIALALGWPQYATRAIVGQQAAHAEAGPAVSPSVWTMVPFALMLGAIALLPLIPATSHWWESNTHKLQVACVLALLTLGYYAFLRVLPMEGHWPAHHAVEPGSVGPNFALVRTTLENALLKEYLPFIVLLFSLYTICGGIRIEGDLRADPVTNATIMAVGAVLASFIGTTGAAMLLIRPLLEANRQRKHVAHTIVMFIFVVCNSGGLLLPLGDPPLFLGYLEGVDFLWTLRLWREWAFVNGMLLVVYVILDRFLFYRKETVVDLERDLERVHKLRFGGLKLNVPLLAGVVFAVALLDPGKAIAGTDWHPWLYLRELVMLVLVAISLWFGPHHVRQQNKFSYGAILEVAVLFIGIFICMQPALEILHVHGGRLGVDTPAKFFWATGGLSSALDNAPTYLVFFKMAQAMPSPPGAQLMAGVEYSILAGISLGAVFMGAMTYIGNGPNFMVKAIAEESGVRMPSFFGFMAYSFAILLPILAIHVWLFLT